MQFIDAGAPERTYLLDSDIPWHSVEHAWGTGYLIADSFTGRWNAPQAISVAPDVIVADHVIGGGVTLRVERRGGDVLRETYRFRNTSDADVQVSSLGIQTPFADLYPGALDALTRRVHAHVFTGGSWAWVAAQPMNGAGRVLGLTLAQGELWGYSVETRNANTISNARGHLVLHVTDHARQPSAFGGQPVVRLPAGGEYVLGWELSWYDDMSSARFSALTARVGEAIRIDTDRTVRAADGVEVAVAAAGGVALTASAPGI